MNDTILNVNNVCKKYPKFELKNVSFNIKRGTIMGFVGRNGAGKTTTLKAIYQLIKLDGGNIYYNDLDISQNEIKCKEDIGLLFGAIDYYPNVKVKVLIDATKRFYKN